MNVVNKEDANSEDKVIICDTLEEFASHTETLRITRTSCITLKIFFPLKYKDWFFSEVKPRDKETQNEEVEFDSDLKLQKILALLNPRLKKELDEIFNKPNGSYSSKHTPYTITTDEFVLAYFFAPGVSSFELPRFRLISSNSNSTESQQKFLPLKHHPLAIYLIVHPSPPCIQNLVAIDPKYEFNSKDNSLEASSYTLTSQKITTFLLKRFKLSCSFFCS